MEIIVAGAGAGKTTSMAKRILSRLDQVHDGKILYVITYTNAARNRIRELIIKSIGVIPKQLRIETIHVFLLHEVIFPFHHLLFEEQFTSVSNVKLPLNRAFKANKLKELNNNKLIHVEKVTETAKWILCKKTKDNKSIREKRERVLKIMSKYLDCVFIDEAQDIDEHMTQIIELLDNKGFNVFLIGDPKQDLRGRNNFKSILSRRKESVTYELKNQRCPLSHVTFSNLYVPSDQKQNPESEIEGEISYVFEKEIESSEEFVKNSNWDMVFIYQKNKRFNTHEERKISNRDLTYELEILIKRIETEDTKKKIIQYELFKEILSKINEVNNFRVFSDIEKKLNIKLTPRDKGRLGEALESSREKILSPGILVNSIDAIKGLEGERCLFIVTTDIAEYLFSKKRAENKMLNYLYVALTRSKKELVLFISLEVQEKYHEQELVQFFIDNRVDKYELK